MIARTALVSIHIIFAPAGHIVAAPTRVAVITALWTRTTPICLATTGAATMPTTVAATASLAADAITREVVASTSRAIVHLPVSMLITFPN